MDRRPLVPVTFVVCNNRRYRALEEFPRLLHVPEGDYLDLAGIGVLDLARGYGLEAHRAEDLQDLTDFVHQGPTAQVPRLVEVHQR
ncbi:hypothetical protein ACFYYN_16620 [Streptomyces sp. NPDC001902]